MESKFKVGDEVYVIINDTPRKMEITGYEFKRQRNCEEERVYYLGTHQDTHAYARHESKLFTLQELLEMIEEL